MKVKGVYKNLEHELKEAKIKRLDLMKPLGVNQNTVTRKLNNKNLLVDDAMIIRDLIKEKTGKELDLEYLFRKD